MSQVNRFFRCTPANYDKMAQQIDAQLGYPNGQADRFLPRRSEAVKDKDGLIYTAILTQHYDRSKTLMDDFKGKAEAIEVAEGDYQNETPKAEQKVAK